MNCVWLKQNKRPNLILFFNGWAMDATVIAHLNTGDNDLLEFHDYTNLSIPAPFDFLSYKTITVIAWSMGVFAAASVITRYGIPFNKAIAINGTPFPVDNDKGIPTLVFEATLASLSPQNLERFYRRICGDPPSFNRFMAMRPDRTFESQRAELESIYAQVRSSVAPIFPWTTALISAHDRIFPSNNQKKAWHHTSMVEYPWHHYPFFNLLSWNELLNPA